MKTIKIKRRRHCVGDAELARDQAGLPRVKDMNWELSEDCLYAVAQQKLSSGPGGAINERNPSSWVRQGNRPSTQGLLDGPTDLVIRIVREHAVLVKYHRWQGAGVVGAPGRQSRVIRVALPCKGDPGISHTGGELERLRAATRHRGSTLGVIEHEGQLRAVESARLPIEDGSLPAKPVVVGGCGYLGRLPGRLAQRHAAHAGRRRHDRVERKGRGARIGLPCCLEHVVCSVSKSQTGDPVPCHSVVAVSPRSSRHPRTGLPSERC